MNSSKQTLKPNTPRSSLDRRGFLKLAFEALQVGVPVGIVYYLFARLRSYLLLIEALDKFSLDGFDSPSQPETNDGISESWNREEIFNITAGENVEGGSFDNGINSPPINQTESSPPVLNLIDGFILGDSRHALINLAEDRLRIMVFIVTNKGSVIPTSRASPFAYSRKTVKQDVFNTSNFSILSFLGADDDEALCSWAHSGILADGSRLFADYLERSIRIDPQGVIRTSAQSIHFIEKELLGASVFLVQESRSGVLPFNPPEGFKLDEFTQGNILQLRINAAARVSNQAVGEYNKHVNGTYNWLRRKPRNVWQQGWSLFNPDTSWILRTCLGTSADEPGFFNISHNRLILMFEPVIALRDPVFDPRMTQG